MTKATILLVDDEPMLTAGLKRNMHKEPYEILTTNSGEQALAIIASGNVDIIISDEMMPGMSGNELLSKIKEGYPSIVRMMLTGNASLDTAIGAINNGEIFRFFIKPVAEAELAKAIKQAVTQRELMKQAYNLLAVTKAQKKTIENLRNNRPDIEQVERDAEGAIIIEESEVELDPEKLIRKIEAEISSH